MPSLEGIDEQAFAAYEQKRFHCQGCPVSCRQEFRVDDGPYAGIQGESVQANTIQDFGTKLDIRYAPAIIKAHLLCNEYGMDIDMVGESVAWAFECYEKGILTERDTGGLQLTWGNHEVLVTLIHQMAYRQGLGDILAEGVMRASEMIGRGSQDLAVSMKGQDLYEDMRIPKGYALGAALSTRGGGHCSGSPIVEFSSGRFSPVTYEGKAELVAYFERFHSVLNSLGVCFFVTVWEGPDLLDEEDLAGLVRAGTGWDVEASELMETGERIHTLERLSNAVYAGFDRKNDYPPERFFCEPIKSGPYRGEVMRREEFDRMLDKNYEIHGWNEQGLPRGDTLEKLGLTQLIKDSSGVYRWENNRPEARTS
jgi:aldehyde:ferredoxin oxidoreductase